MLFLKIRYHHRILYDNTKANEHSPDGVNNSFVIITGVLQAETLAPFSYLPNSSARAGYDTRSIFEAKFNRFKFRVFLLLD